MLLQKTGVLDKVLMASSSNLDNWFNTLVWVLDKDLGANLVHNKCVFVVVVVVLPSSI